MQLNSRWQDPGAPARRGVHVVRLPPRSRNLNAFAERFVRSIKEECLDRIIFFGQASLRHAITQFVTHYHDEHNIRGYKTAYSSRSLRFPNFTVEANGFNDSVECSAIIIAKQLD